MYLFESLNQLIQNYLPEDQIKRLRQAYLVARDAHEGQTRSSGEPYITHPVAVACILAEMKLDYETLMAALLHDVDDRKLSPMTAEKKENAARFMRSQNVSESEIRQVCQIIDEVSFKGTDSVRPSTPEGKCVQDADRLDALGAIGIARTFAYGGSHNRTIYDPELPPRTAMNQAQYYSSKSTSLNHFYEKLFLLEGMMNTETGKAIARKRTQYMQQFVDEFLNEWDGLDK